MMITMMMIMMMMIDLKFDNDDDGYELINIGNILFNWNVNFSTAQVIKDVELKILQQQMMMNTMTMMLTMMMMMDLK